MNLKTFLRNKNNYLAYNDFRKAIFSELSPKDAEAILYQLPWMLSVNDPAVPGYVQHLERKGIMVHGVTSDRTLMARDATFKKMFNIKTAGPLLRPMTHALVIEGLYTIGSSGTISQTAASDCDIWVCIDKSCYDQKAMECLSQKLNLIKDWMDANLKMPVYFFICDIEDIRKGHFGNLDEESSGSAQRNVLKEEFYRTSILINGKIPLWWACFEPDAVCDYQTLERQYAKGAFEDYDFIDMGALASVDSDEYFGAALWQFNKALTHPLKSVIKMLLLEMLLAAPREELLCHRFRNMILSRHGDDPFYDPSMFTLTAVLEYKQHHNPKTFAFIRQCCYLRYEIKFHTKKITIKETLARKIFADFPLTREEITRLNDFSSWPLHEQLEYGDKILALLMTIYKEIKARQEEGLSSLTKRDMNIVGRKLAVCLEKRHNKLPVLHKPMYNLNLPGMIFVHEKKSWIVGTVGEAAKPVIASTDITYCIAYLVWNGIYHELNVRMAPNPSPITLQEINNLARSIRDVFGPFDITKIDFANFQEPEKVTKMLIIISFEGARQLKDVNDFTVIYSNHWGELFHHRFNGSEKFKAFVESGGKKFSKMEMFYYVQRNSLYYEKIIERTKRLVTHLFENTQALAS